VYHNAPALARQGERTVSTDELTGVQALERKHPGLPLVPGKVERREFEYTRHGTRAFILSRDVVTGKLLAPHAGLTFDAQEAMRHGLLNRRRAIQILDSLLKGSEPSQVEVISPDFLAVIADSSQVVPATEMLGKTNEERLQRARQRSKKQAK
jgi:hypothetical protein